jgi:hypothetical protein
MCNMRIGKRLTYSVLSTFILSADHTQNTQLLMTHHYHLAIVCACSLHLLQEGFLLGSHGCVNSDYVVGVNY